MLICRIAVENFRKLRDPIEIGGLQPGLNVIIGDNEEGKSTLLKAVQAAFFDRYSLSGDAVEAMLPFGSQVQPKLEIKFKIGETSYSLCKGFHQASFARLKNVKRHWENTAAEDKLREILGFTRPGRGPAKDENRGLSGPLWVEQGRAFEPLKLNDDTKRALEAVTSEVKATTSGDDGPKLLAAVDAEVRKYYTNVREDEKAALTNQRVSAKSLEHEVKSLKDKKAEYDSMLHHLEKIVRDLPNLRQAFALANNRLNTLNNRITKIDELEGKVNTRNSLLETAEAKLENAKSKVETRQNKVKSLSDTQSEANNRGIAFSNLDKRYKDAEAKMAKAERKLKIAQREYKRAKLKVYVDKLDAAKDIADRVAEKKEAIEDISIKNEDVENLLELKGELGKQKARLEGMATALFFSPSRNQSVWADGRELEVAKPVRITEKALYELEGFGKLEVTPGGEEDDIRSYQSAANDLQKKLSDALMRFGYPSVEEASAARSKKNKVLGEIRIAKAKLEGIAPGGLDDLRSNIERLRKDLPSITDSTVPLLPVNEAEERLRDAQSELEMIRLGFSDLQNEWSDEKGALKQLSRDIDLRQKELDEDRGAKSDGNLEQEAQNASKVYRKHQKRLDKLKSELAELSPDSSREQLRREEQSCKSLQESLNGKEQREGELKAELRGLGTLGLGEQIDEKGRELENARRELERLELDAKAWKLLRDTLQEAEQDERVPLRPLMMRLAPYIDMVFSGGELRLEKSSLEIEKLHRGSDEPFSSLSIGTREQIAVLVRLAMADLLREQGKPVMLILDDPLVNSDDGRFDRMACALRRAAKHLQILILTCHETRYKSLGANTIRLMKREGGASIAKLLAMPNAKGIDFEPARLSGNLCKPADLS